MHSPTQETYNFVVSYCIFVLVSELSYMINWGLVNTVRKPYYTREVVEKILLE